MSLFISSSRINNLIRSSLFLLGLFLFLSISGYLISCGGKKSGGKVNWIMSHSIDAEIPIFGSSVAHVQFNPKIIGSLLGKSCYNLGMNGINFPQYNGSLQEFITYTQTKFIVIAGTFNEFESRGQLYEASSFINHLDNKHIYEGLKRIDTNQTIKAAYFPFYKFTLFDSKFYSSAFKGIISPSPSPFDDPALGFLPRNDPWTPLKNSDINEAKDKKIDMGIVNNFRNTIFLANRKGIKVILVLPPIYKDGQKQISNLEEIKEVYRDLASKGNVFLDFTSSDICLNRNFFYNNTHLNSKGADVFSNDFAVKLKSIP